MMNGTLCKTSQGNESFPDARATARIAPTIDDNLAMPPATGYGRSDPYGRSDSLVHNISDTPAPQDLFATAPMTAMWRELVWQREEEAYTSFEAAISNRVLVLKERYINTCMETGESRSVASALHTLASVAITFRHKVCSRRVWRRSLLLASLAFMLVLVGFDLMGLLILYAR